MAVILGLVIILGMVFGGYSLAGGKFGVILYALPFELMMIGGASLGAFVVGNKTVVMKGVLKGLGKAFKGSKWKKKDYKDLLALLFELIKVIKSKGVLELESHIEKPEESTIFKKYPNILHDHFAIELICDTLRLMTMGFINPYHAETNIQNQIDKHHHEEAAAASALQTMSDGLPAIGIVAAVLGVIKTMASVTEPPEILGKMIAGALVGTFLGVFLSYCLVGPIASRIMNILDEEVQFYLIIRDVMIANLQGNAAQISVEIGRGNIPTYLQPSFFELEKALNGEEASTNAA
jgi:chemotaxis protein MotA